jgi:hypothetical protein
MLVLHAPPSCSPKTWANTKPKYKKGQRSLKLLLLLPPCSHLLGRHTNKAGFVMPAQLLWKRPMQQPCPDVARRTDSLLDCLLPLTTRQQRGTSGGIDCVVLQKSDGDWKLFYEARHSYAKGNMTPRSSRGCYTTRRITRTVLVATSVLNRQKQHLAVTHYSTSSKQHRPRPVGRLCPPLVCCCSHYTVRQLKGTRTCHSKPLGPCRTLRNVVTSTRNSEGSHFSFFL